MNAPSTSSTGGLLFPGLLVTTALTLRLVIISFRPAWLARVLLSFKRTQSSGNDDADEGQKTPFGALMIICARVLIAVGRRLLTPLVSP